MSKELDKARQLVQEDMKARAEAMGEELKTLLEKHNCSLQVGEQGIFIQPLL